MRNCRRTSWFLVALLAICFASGFWYFNQKTEIETEAIQYEGYTVLPDTITHSERDNRQYQAIRLDNDMTVLLVSDPQAVKSLGSLALPVGSLHDPKQQQGLAHYTEHMVLMGSQRYPEPDGFSEFLSQNAGSYNASTAGHRTAFYFEVANEAFQPALDRLADTIAEPLLNPTYADKERNAVNAELTMARSNDGFRIGQVDAETINQQHPASLFSGGNLETLSNKEGSVLQDELVKFYTDYYSANLMVGVVYSQQSLPELAQIAVETFGRINNKHAQVEPIVAEAITKTELAKMIYVEPAQPKKLLYMQFPIANNITDFADKTDEYIGYLISNRSENTLVDTLQKQGFIESISAGGDPINYGNSGLFSISVSLTDKGLEQKDKVITAIFNNIKLLRQQGIAESYFEEIKKVLALAFKYPDINRDMGYVEWLSDQMLLYPLTDVLDADYVADHFNAQAIADRLDSLIPENARIWVIAPGQPQNKIAYFVNTPYQIDDITAAQMQQWQQLGKDFSFKLPELNTYIPDDFSLVEQSTTSLNEHVVEFDPEGIQIHIPSQYFQDEPKAALVLSLRNNDILLDAKQQVSFQLLDYLVNRSMSQLRFQASVAGMSLSTQSSNGLMLSVDGFSQHLPDMMKAMLTQYQQLEINQDDLALAQSWYLERLNAADSVKSYSLALQPIQALASVPYIERDVKREVTGQLTVSDIMTYRDQLLTQAAPYMLTIGNITEQQSAALYGEVRQQLGTQGRFSPVERIMVKDKLLAAIQQKAASTDYALAMTYVPFDYDEVTSRATSLLLNKVLYPWFFTQLRSDEQLGYAVFTFPMQVGVSSGIGFLIQSNQYDPAYLYERYQAFYPQALEKLHAMSNDEFNQYKQGLLNELRQPPQTLNEELGLYFSDFVLSRFDFNSRQNLIAAVESLTQEAFVEFYQHAVVNQDGLVISSQVFAKQDHGDKVSTQGFVELSNASSLQQALLEP